MKITDQDLFNKLKQETGLSGRDLKNAIKNAGIRNFDSRNDYQLVINTIPKNDPGPGTETETETETGTDTKPESNPLTEEYNDLLQKYNSQTAAYEDLEGRVANLKDKVGDRNDEILYYQNQVGNLRNQIGAFDSQISDYRSQVSSLTDQYSGALRANQDLMSERDSARQQFADQSAAYQAAMQERDMYRDMNVNQQLSSLRGGATAGGANQASYRTGTLASGKTGYDSGARDRELAERVSQEGMTDSVLAREAPVVELIDRGQQERKQGSGQVRGMTTSAGTGSYYASRFGR